MYALTYPTYNPHLQPPPPPHSGGRHSCVKVDSLMRTAWGSHLANESSLSEATFTVWFKRRAVQKRQGYHGNYVVMVLLCFHSNDVVMVLHTFGKIYAL